MYLDDCLILHPYLWALLLMAMSHQPSAVGICSVFYMFQWFSCRFFIGICISVFSKENGNYLINGRSIRWRSKIKFILGFAVAIFGLIQFLDWREQ